MIFNNWQVNKRPEGRWLWEEIVRRVRKTITIKIKKRRIRVSPRQGFILYAGKNKRKSEKGLQKNKNTG